MKSLINRFSRWGSQNLLHHDSLGGYFEPVIQLFKPNWRAGLYRAQVSDVSLLLEGVVAINLRVEDRWPIHQAGQHIELTLEIAGKLVTRVFTVASSPNLAKTKSTIRLVVKIQSEGGLTLQLPLLTTGDWVNISAPRGEFVFEEAKQSSLFLAAGSGITPFIAILSSLQKERAIEQPIHLIYYAKPEQHLLVDELNELSQQLPLFTFELMSRSVHGDVYEQLSDYIHAKLLVCGPNRFYQSAKEFAKTYNCSLSAEHFSLLNIAQSTQSEFDVSLNGKQLSLNNNSPLLNQLLALGEQVNFGCKIGVCHQCQCIKKSGVVKDIRTGQVSDRSEELIQLCVSQVLTDLELET